MKDYKTSEDRLNEKLNHSIHGLNAIISILIIGLLLIGFGVLLTVVPEIAENYANCL